MKNCIKPNKRTFQSRFSFSRYRFIETRQSSRSQSRFCFPDIVLWKSVSPTVSKQTLFFRYRVPRMILCGFFFIPLDFPFFLNYITMLPVIEARITGSMKICIKLDKIRGPFQSRICFSDIVLWKPDSLTVSKQDLFPKNIGNRVPERCDPVLDPRKKGFFRFFGCFSWKPCYFVPLAS